MPNKLRDQGRPAPIASRFLRPFAAYAKNEAASGIFLISAALIAILLANSPWSQPFFDFWQIRFQVGFGDLEIDKPILLWINDGLMAIFFFLVGLEIKREFLVGELASPRRAALPIFAALGGMAVPALLYAVFNLGHPSIRGWGVPMATDIAFALGVLNLLGPRVPLAIKVFLAAVAIVDDIGAVLVIAIFYSGEIQWRLLGFGGLVFGGLILLNRLGIRKPLAYFVPGALLWVLFLKSGVHATVAGVLVAMTIPARVHLNPESFVEEAKEALAEFESGTTSQELAVMNESQQSAVHELEEACERIQMPLQRIEHGLQPFVSFLIMPLFALANAGVLLKPGTVAGLGQPISFGVLAGLILGKPIGVVLASWIAVKAGAASLPDRVIWLQMAGVGILAGIGFTMSLFIADLAFANPAHIETAKVAIFIASLFSGALGYWILRSCVSEKPIRSKPA
ncbi:MAG: Na+/H+ antiporter NhaA [Fimbriimonadaceae bacterium]|nr:Na+/H+ antiporter NhaA [Fimbriimonadaceae bacterium]